ncbi:unnamed protein product [Gadus morhua 'NCC']
MRPCSQPRAGATPPTEQGWGHASYLRLGWGHASYLRLVWQLRSLAAFSFIYLTAAQHSPFHHAAFQHDRKQDGMRA